jgi:hypothetical protein
VAKPGGGGVTCARGANRAVTRHAEKRRADNAIKTWGIKGKQGVQMGVQNQFQK